jgi:hypothetical protein
MTAMRKVLCLCLAAALCVVVATVATPAFASDQDAIRAAMMKTWDKPDARLVVDPVVVSGDHAIAGWSQGDMGGRALLRKKGHAWDVVLCAGDDLKKTDVLTKVGLPAAAAKALSASLATAEAKVPPDRLALFSKFEGLVMVSGEGHHGHGQPAGHQPHGHQPHGHKP